MVLESETSLEAYGPILNLILVFLLASIVALIIMFAYAKHRAKKSLEAERKAEAEREFLKVEKQKEQAMRIEETGYSERDEKAYEDEDSDEDGE